ncbi:MAG: class I SAM-dependent rRNA methyltransferase [Gammaproteobacteria bacterium]|jgi:23S rRNA (cytosine1962-C5)-methyltransferase
MSDPSLPVLRLKRHEERRLRAGHLWIFSNEVDTQATPLNDFSPGQVVEIQDSGGRALGTGYVNPHSLICARLVSRDPRVVLDAALIGLRLTQALALRERLFAEPYYRLVHAEGDGLPGLVVDRYGDVLVVQITTAGMEVQQDVVLEVLQTQLAPKAIVLRNDTAVRELEGLPQEIRVAHGELADILEVRENHARYRVAVSGGQKTGWFYDQRDNRARLGRYVRLPGARVLDVFSYVGSFGIQAALAGADEVVCVDASQQALGLLRENAALNDVAARVETVHGDAFEALRALRGEGQRFDVVVVDPPAFIKRRKDIKAGEQAYRLINRLAMQVLADDGILVSCSCSFHLSREALVRQMQHAAQLAGRSLQILEHGYQGPDHPMHPAIAETAYLKAVFARIL